ncbi:MAG TPA: DUF4292 domain-containing protein [Anaeromyxobacter sp.]|nr:DUF4292 domain-containing protein [Anaeromyxobacter sp.]
MRATLAAACAALWAVGCHPRTPPPDLSLDPAALLSQLAAAQAMVRTVQGEARVRYRSPRGSATVRQFAAAERPDRVHIEELDFFGNPAAVLVTGGGSFSFYDARQKVLYQGAATPRNLERLVPLPFSAPDLVAILLGGAPLVPQAGGEARADPEDGAVRLRLPQGDVSEEVWVGAGARALRASRQVAGGAGPGSWEATFSAFRERAGAPFPGVVAIRSPPAHVEVELTWTEVEVNGELDPGLFRLEPPRGARVEEVGEGP